MASLWNEEAECLSGDALDALHLAKLKKMLVRVNEMSPHYREKFERAGVNPYEFSSFEHYRRYPTFDKYEERESQARSKAELGHPLGRHITCDIGDVNRMSASSGTSGTPSFQGHTKNDRRIQNENFARMFKRIGVEPGDRVLFAGVMSMWVAGLPSVDGLLDYGANVIPVGALVGSMKVAEMAALTRPQVVMSTPSFLRHMVKSARQEETFDLADIGVEKLIVYGEPGGSVPEIIDELSQGYGGAAVYDAMGGTSCMNPIFVSCEAHDGMHFIAPDHAYVEIRDLQSGEYLPIEGELEGEAIYTGLDRECGPLIRFCDGDKVRITTDACSCGRPGWRMKVIGRTDDMLLVKGVNVFPSAIQDIAVHQQNALTGNIRILKFAESPTIEPPLQLWAECVGAPSDADKATIKAKFEEEIQRALRFKVEATLFSEGKMEMEFGATNKAKTFKKMYE